MHPLPVKFDKHALSLIDVLLSNSAPSTVVRPVAFIVVGPIQAHPLGRVAHISVEVLKTLPSLTDRDAPATVTLVIVSVWITASVSHVLPGHVGSGT